jgi:hypothetical protein
MPDLRTRGFLAPSSGMTSNQETLPTFGHPGRSIPAMVVYVLTVLMVCGLIAIMVWAPSDSTRKHMFANPSSMPLQASYTSAHPSRP